MIHLKSKDKGFNDPNFRCGLLADPDLTGIVHNDAELYAEIARWEKEVGDLVTVIPCKKNNPMELDKPEKLSAQEFCRQWRGD